MYKELELEGENREDGQGIPPTIPPRELEYEDITVHHLENEPPLPSPSPPPAPPPPRSNGGAEIVSAGLLRVE